MKPSAAGRLVIQEMRSFTFADGIQMRAFLTASTIQASPINRRSPVAGEAERRRGKTQESGALKSRLIPDLTRLVVLTANLETVRKLPALF